jgi:cell division protein FtsW (lipid II flippase)
MNLALVLMPTIQEGYYLALLLTVLLLNCFVGWVVLNDIQSSDSEDHPRLGAFSRRWVIWLGASSAAMLLILGLMERLHKQALPFFIFSIAFLSVAYRVFDISVEKTIQSQESKIRL